MTKSDEGIGGILWPQKILQENLEGTFLLNTNVSLKRCAPKFENFLRSSITINTVVPILPNKSTRYDINHATLLKISLAHHGKGQRNNTKYQVNKKSR